MKLLSLALTALLSVSTLAVATPEWNHPDIDPDVLQELFVKSSMIHCEAGKCKDVFTSAPYQKEVNWEGWMIVFDGIDMAHKDMPKYMPYVKSLYSEMAADLGVPMEPIL